MLKLNGVKKYFLSTLACLFMLFAAQAMHAQIGTGNVQLTFDGASVVNGGSNATGATVTAGTSLSGSVYVNGVTGNNGTTYVSCYDSIAGFLFSWSTQVSGYTTLTFTPNVNTHQMYCTANYTGQFVNGTASTATLSFTAVAP